MGKVFINLTNRASKTWLDDQLKAAQEYGDIIDLPFPNIDPDMEPEEVVAMAEKYTAQIMTYDVSAVLVQGEMTFTFAVVSGLKRKGIKTVAACSRRESVETRNEDGSVTKNSVFRFCQFREY